MEQDRGPVFFRFAKALSALYPKERAEKRLQDAMLPAMPRSEEGKRKKLKRKGHRKNRGRGN